MNVEKRSHNDLPGVDPVKFMFEMYSVLKKLLLEFQCVFKKSIKLWISHFSWKQEI